MILYFDTETTGLVPGRIVQLSYLMQTEKEVKAKNFFFYVDYVEPSALAVHGFSPERLLELSGGNTFSCDADEIYDDFISADLIISHNFPFDLKFMIAEFAYIDRRFRYKESLCSMRHFTDILKLERSGGRRYKYPKLGELAEFYGVYPYDVTRAEMKFFGSFGLSHDARYDTCALFLSFNAAADGDAGVGAIREKYVSSDIGSGEGGNHGI